MSEIILSPDQIINQPSLAILIDCWDSQRSDGKNALDYQILSFLEDSPHIQTIVLASYCCRRENVEQRSVWHQNYNKMFKGTHAPRKIRELADVHNSYNHKADEPHNNNATHPNILNYINLNKFQIAMLWLWELEYYLENNKEIKNIYVFGAAWEDCVRRRSLGYEALTEFLNINILTNLNCVHASYWPHRPDLSTDQNWKSITEDIWQYQK